MDAFLEQHMEDMNKLWDKGVEIMDVEFRRKKERNMTRKRKWEKMRNCCCRSF